MEILGIYLPPPPTEESSYSFCYIKVISILHILCVCVCVFIPHAFLTLCLGRERVRESPLFTKGYYIEYWDGAGVL